MSATVVLKFAPAADQAARAPRRAVTGKVKAGRGPRPGGHQFLLFRGYAAHTWLRSVAKVAAQ